MLTSKHPEAIIASMVAYDGGYNPCKNMTKPGFIRLFCAQLS